MDKDQSYYEIFSLQFCTASAVLQAPCYANILLNLFAAKHPNYNPLTTVTTKSVAPYMDENTSFEPAKYDDAAFNETIDENFGNIEKN